MTSWDKGLGLVLGLRRVMGDDQLRGEFIAEAALRGVEGLKGLLERHKAQLDPRLYRELYILLHERPPPEPPEAGTGIKR